MLKVGYKLQASPQNLWVTNPQLKGYNSYRQQEILALAREGKTQKEIAAKVGVTQSCVSQIIKNNDEIIFYNGDAADTIGV